MPRSFAAAVPLFIALGTVVQAASCDARARALDLFKEQGLNLLQPARDYIVPGGLFVVARGAKPNYEDPRDPVAPESGNLTDFRAVILQQTATHSTSFGGALALAATVLPFNVGLRGNSEVRLGQIQTTGVRLRTDAVEALIEKARTREAIKTQLSQGRRVFVVQEIYKATSLNLQAANNKALDVTYNDQRAIAECKEAVLKGSEASPSPSVKPTDATSPKNEAKPTAKDAKPEGAKTPAASPSPGESKPSAAASPKPASGGVAACRSGQFELTLSITDPIPFAVRLVELERKGDLVRRKPGGTLSTTLGNNQEIGASLISDASPTLDDVQRAPRPR
jgi:hypothetical protein